jgi:diguanylate cyclase (GGDEF)-like protein
VTQTRGKALSGLPVRVFRAIFVVAAIASLPALLVSHPMPQDWLFVAAWALAAAGAAWFGLGFPAPGGVFSLEWVCVLTVLAGQGPLAAALAGIAPILVRLHRRREPHTIFEVALMILAVQGAQAAMRMVPGDADSMVALPVGALALFACLSLPQAASRSLEERQRMLVIWREQSLWSVPYYLAGAVVAGLLLTANPLPVWTARALGVALLLLLSRSFHAQVGELEQSRREASEFMALQKEMLEALAMAVEARESGGRVNLHRIGETARMLGESLGLPGREMKALELAALLHDLGKMAVPDYILSKPGRLQPEEEERLRLHPMVAAEIVERARFSYPVAPMIRSHHERWDGKGYPDGLAGKQIPLGARILAVVDALDGLLSERSYRRALPFARAIEAIERDAGSAFDPEVVRALRARATELEAALHTGAYSTPPAFVQAINEAHREEQQIQELLRELNPSFETAQVIPVIEERLRRVLPLDAAIVWLEKDGRLCAGEAFGPQRDLLLCASLPAGEGVSSKAAGRRQALVNAPAGTEWGHILGRQGRAARARSALAVPFVNDQGVMGVFTAYSAAECPYEGRHARLLAAFAPRFSSWMESARRYQQAEEQASMDALTGLPNAAALYLQLQQEIARNTRDHKRLAVLVCDLDGFKSVNDTFGHLAGNQVLQAVATGLRERCREYDFVARMGGDEFVILLPGIGEESIEDRTHSFGLAVTQAGLRVCGHPAVSLSIGVAYAPADGVAPDELLARADERMYANKRWRKSTRDATPPDTVHVMYPQA